MSYTGTKYMGDDNILYPTKDEYDERRKLRKEKGCGYWQAEVNLPNCSFPRCMCYPTFRSKG